MAKKKKYSVHGKVGTKGERKRRRQESFAVRMGLTSRTATRRKRKR